MQRHILRWLGWLWLLPIQSCTATGSSTDSPPEGGYNIFDVLPGVTTARSLNDNERLVEHWQKHLPRGPTELTPKMLNDHNSEITKAVDSKLLPAAGGLKSMVRTARQQALDEYMRWRKTSAAQRNGEWPRLDLEELEALDNDIAEDAHQVALALVEKHDKRLAPRETLAMFAPALIRWITPDEPGSWRGEYWVQQQALQRLFALHGPLAPWLYGHAALDKSPFHGQAPDQTRRRRGRDWLGRAPRTFKPSSNRRMPSLASKCTQFPSLCWLQPGARTDSSSLNGLESGTATAKGTGTGTGLGAKHHRHSVYEPLNPRRYAI